MSGPDPGERGRALAKLGGVLVSLVTVNLYSLWEALSAVWKAFRPRREPLLDWECASWRSIYAGEVDRALTLSFDDLAAPIELPQLLVLDNTVRALAPSAFRVRVDAAAPEFQLPARYRGRNAEVLARHRKPWWLLGSSESRSVRNCARLKEYDADSRTLVCQKVSYADYLQSNQAMDYHGGAPLTLREELHAGARALEPLPVSSLANVMGINFLVFTQSGGLVVSRRSRWVAVRPRELGPPASGSVDYTDVFASATHSLALSDIPLLREAEEELGRAASDSLGVLGDSGETIARGQWVLLGITRELIRGGKPEVFGVCWSGLEIDELRASLKTASHRWETSKLLSFPFGPYHYRRLETEPERARFRAAFRDLWKRIHAAGKVSIPLETGLALWFRYRLNGH